MRPLTTDILVKCGANKAAAAKYVDLFNELFPHYSINTFLRASHLISQLCHESVGLTAVREYASGAAYEGRINLGNTHPGDGIKYAGRGLIQLTGRTNYTAFAKKFGIDCVNHPELIEQPRWAVASALDFWNTRNLNAFADKDDGLKITRTINGGVNGLDHRMALLTKAKLALLPLFS